MMTTGKMEVMSRVESTTDTNGQDMGEAERRVEMMVYYVVM